MIPRLKTIYDKEITAKLLKRFTAICKKEKEKRNQQEAARGVGDSLDGKWIEKEAKSKDRQGKDANPKERRSSEAATVSGRAKINPKTGQASTRDVRMQFEEEQYRKNRYGKNIISSRSTLSHSHTSSPSILLLYYITHTPPRWTEEKKKEKKDKRRRERREKKIKEEEER